MTTTPHMTGGEHTKGPLSERITTVSQRGHDVGCNVFSIGAEGMPKFQLDDATEPLTLQRVAREVLKWVEGTHAPSVTFIKDRGDT